MPVSKRRRRKGGGNSFNGDFQEAIRICAEVIGRLQGDGKPLHNLPGDLRKLQNGVAPATTTTIRKGRVVQVPCADYAKWYRHRAHETK